MYNIYFKHKPTDKILLVDITKDITDENVNSEMKIIVLNSKTIYGGYFKAPIYNFPSSTEVYTYKVNEIFHHKDFEIINKTINFDGERVIKIIDCIYDNKVINDDNKMIKCLKSNISLLRTLFYKIRRKDNENIA